MSTARLNRRHWLEISAWCMGLGLLATYGAMRAWSAYVSADGLAAMREARAVAALPDDNSPSAGSPAQPDMSTWSTARIAAYRERIADAAMPAAVLRIPSLKLAVPVYAGTSETTLNRGAGLIDGTAQPGSDGNIGIAAHRDGFFRPLKDISVGATLYLEQADRTRRYRVTQIRIVEPTEVDVLHATSRPSLTLVTCYPFYYIGAAPRRFIVRAEAQE